MTATTNTTFAKREIYVNEIVFYAKDEVSLFGFIHEGGKFEETQFVIARNALQMLLSANKPGIEILWHIENLFVKPHQVPASINLIDLFGTTQVFEAQNIELDVPFYEDETGELKPCNSRELLFVEQVVPFPSARKNSF